MKYILLLIVFAFSYSTSFTQSFEWAASGSNLITGYSCSAVTPDGRLIAAGDYSVPSYQISSEEKGLYDGAGNLHKLQNAYSDQFFVSCMGPSGKMEWMISGSEYAANSRLRNVCAKPDGNIIVAFTGYRISEFPISFCDELGEIEGFGVGEEVPHKTDSIFENQHRNGQLDLIYLAEFNRKGNLVGYHAFRFKENDTWFSFECAPDGTMYFTTTDSYHVIENGKGMPRGGNIIVRISPDFKTVNRKIFEYITPTCCSHMEPGMLCTISDRGELFVGGTYHTGIRVDGARDHMVKPTADYNSKYFYNSYVAKLNPVTLKLDWIRHSEGWTHIKAITVTDHEITIGGRVQFNNTAYKQKLDTTGAKKAFLISMNLSGDVLWSQTFNAEDVNALCHDFGGNIYTSYRSKRSKGLEPLKIGSDTISNTYERIVVAAFDKNGNYKWSKKSNAMMSNDPHSKLHCDPCGNIYFTGEMWYVLPVNMSLFDAAFVAGRGYGGAPVAARIRTTIPDELLAINTVFSVPLSRDKKAPQKEKNKTKTADRKQDANPTSSAQIPADSTKSQGRSKNDLISCIPIPFPWKMEVYPNPTGGELHLKCITSYNDNSVSVEIRDAKGALIRVLQPPKLQEAGEWIVDTDCSDLSSGVYIAVLKGSQTGVTTRFVVAR